MGLQALSASCHAGHDGDNACNPHLLNTLVEHALVRLEQGVENVHEATPEAYRRRTRRAKEDQ